MKIPDLNFDFSKDVVVKKSWGEMYFNNEALLSDPHYEEDCFEKVQNHDWGNEKLICYDLGANQGLWTCFLATFRPNTFVYAFEPHPLNFASLVRNVSLLKLKNVFCCYCALGAHNKIGDLYLNFSQGGDHTGAFNIVKKEGENTIKVHVRRLDSFDFPKPGFVKMDVEREELNTLIGMGKMLEDNNVKMMIEAHDGLPYFIDHLLGFGFKTSPLSRGVWVYKE